MTDYHMIPMIDCLKENVQNKNHIIEEEVGWVRSGIPSRQVIRNKDYLENADIITMENIGVNKLNQISS